MAENVGVDIEASDETKALQTSLEAASVVSGVVVETATGMRSNNGTGTSTAGIGIGIGASNRETGDKGSKSEASATTSEKTATVSSTAPLNEEEIATKVELMPVVIDSKQVEKLASLSLTTKATEQGETEGETAPIERKWTDIPTHERLSKIEKRFVYMSLCMGMFLAALDQMIVIVCLPTIVSELGGEQYLAWVLSAYLLTSSATMPLYGKFSDIHGRRLTYVLSLVLFLAGSLACGFSRGIWYLIGFRGLQGLGGGGLMSLSVILIGDIVKPASRAKYMSSISAIFGVATVVGPVLGGFFTDYISWRWVFFINMPFGAVTLVVCWIVLKKIKNAQKELSMDVLGSLLVFFATVCVVLLVTWGGADYAWDSWEILLLIFGSIALFLVFGLQEMRHPEPIINLRLFRIRNFAITCTIMIFFGISMFGGFSFLPIFFQDICGDSAIISGLKLVPMVIGMMFSSMGTGLYVSKTGNFIWFPKFGMAFVAIGEGLLALLTKHMSFGVEWIFLFIMGIGMGMAFPVFNGIVQNSVPEKDMASSVAGVTFVRSIGGSVGVAIFGSVLSQQTKKNYNRYNDATRAETEALHLVFLCSMAPGLLAFILTFFIKKTDIFVRKGAQPAPIME